MKQLFEVNQEVLSKPIVIYGAGNAGMDLMVELLNRGIRVECFCDSSPEKWGIKLMNKLVISPTELYEKKDDINVVIASMFFNEINEELKKNDVKNIFCYRDSWRIHI